MKRLTDGFSAIGGDGRERWFAGANTDTGFSGSYGEIVNEEKLERLYVIKGGPGTGKSTLMKQAADAAEKAGHAAVRYLCGSDPESLDAVVIDGRVALADGTAPHPLELLRPGASSSLVDLSRFWDSGILTGKIEAIRANMERKRTAYREAYRFLGAAGRMVEEMDALAAGCFDREKAAGFAGRLIRRLRREGAVRSCGECSARYSHGITMRGLWKTDGAEIGTERSYVIEDAMGTASLFLAMLAEGFREAGIGTVRGLYPIRNRIAELKAGSCSFRIGRAEAGEIPIRMTRFVLPEAAERGRMRLTERIAVSSLDAASDALSRAAEAHFALEGIYMAAMDFDRLAEYRREVTEEVLVRLESR
ncbi:MAG: hypothetical protein E7576_04670 [Ruminococcaceae bacterium]|nr:hypothetical protein [Oscillospiraceae bacterium]